MGWRNFTFAWKGVIVGGLVALISSVVMTIFLFFSMGGIVGQRFLAIVASLTLIKLVWGVILGYFIGSFFSDI